MKDKTNRARKEASHGARDRQIDEAHIAQRAYEIYESRGRGDGHADDDWFQAAAEYARRSSASAPVAQSGASNLLGEKGRKARR